LKQDSCQGVEQQLPGRKKHEHEHEDLNPESQHPTSNTQRSTLNAQRSTLIIRGSCASSIGRWALNVERWAFLSAFPFGVLKPSSLTRLAAKTACGLPSPIYHLLSSKTRSGGGMADTYV
jgi:hypothetical protein